LKKNLAEPEQSADEIKHLNKGINDLIGVIALPAIWRGEAVSDRWHFAHVLLKMLGLVSSVRD
jgi:hypothetical protein